MPGYTRIEDLPELGNDSYEGGDSAIGEGNKYRDTAKFIRNNRQIPQGAGMTRNSEYGQQGHVMTRNSEYGQQYQQPPPEEMIEPQRVPMVKEMPAFSRPDPMSFNCVDISMHVQECPICCKFYNGDKSLYIVVIVILAIVCLLLLKRVLNV
jgi:hypothetical protein